MTKYVFDFTEGDKDQKDLLGGKGANLAEMTKLGLPVPPGFTITTEACREYLAFGAEPLAEESGDERFAWDSYRRLLQMFGKTVLEMPGDVFSDALDNAKSAKGVASDLDLDVDVDDLRALVTTFKDAVREHSGHEFPQHPRVSGSQLVLLVFPQFDRSSARELLTKGMAASPGAAVGRAVFDSPTAKAWAERGEQVVLVRKETNPDDLEGMIAANGILTARGGKTSHAAVVARGMGRTCVCGADALDVAAAATTVTVGSVVINEGDQISIDGSTGEVFLGAMPVVPSPVETYIESGLAAALDGADNETTALVNAVDRLLTHADVRRRLAIPANADTVEDAVRARSLGAQCIGPCRTEHMFLGGRRALIERVILAGTTEERDDALAALLPLQRKDLTELLDAMDGLPVNIRLLDPPLHEFLSDRTERAVKAALAEARGDIGEQADADRQLLAAVEKLHESNPMLGVRGVRLGLLTQGLFALQVRAVAEATSDQIAVGKDPRVEIMVPLVGSVMELHLVRDEAEAILAEVAAAKGVTPSIPIGTMIELPRVALTAHRIADAADFFSFGTNDLTQTTWDFSRDNVKSSVFTVSPFETIDGDGVGRLVEIAAKEGRTTKPGLKLGVCGEHGGDLESIHFVHKTGLD